MSKLRFLPRLKIWQKLILIAVCMGLPIPLITYLYVSEKNNTIKLAQKELYGTAYLSPLKGVAKEMMRHRRVAHAFLNGDATVQNYLLNAEQAVEQQLATAAEIDQRPVPGKSISYGALLQTTGQLQALSQKWEVLKNKTRQSSLAESFNEHTQLIGEVFNLIKYTADQSALVLDPDLDSYYLMDATIVQIPRLQEEVERLRSLGVGIGAAKRATSGELVEMANLISQLQADLKGLERAFNVAHNFNPILKEQHAGHVELTLKAVADFAALTERTFIRTVEINSLPAPFRSMGTQNADPLQQLDELVVNELQTLVKSRIANLTRERNSILGITAMALLSALLVVMVIARNITGQAREITELIAAIEAGNLDARAQVSSADELGLAAQAFNEMLDNTRGLIQSRDERDQIQRSIIKLLDEVSSVAEGDLTREAEVTDDITGAIADAFNYMMANLCELIGKVQNVTTQVTSTANETQNTATHLAQGSQEQAAQVNQTTEALAEMTASIQEVSQHAERSAAVADQSLQTARHGAQAVQNTVQGMDHIQEQVQETARRIRQLSERSQEIGEIVQLIDDIADRTSVLALNASIQAAVAGEAGQGFAVVAAEVEQLANRSTEATKRIGHLIRTIQSGTQEALAAMEETTREVLAGARLANQAGQSLNEIETVSQQLAELVRSISLACQQQARSSERLSHTMQQIAALTNQTTNGVMQSAETVKSLAALADELRASVASFKVSSHSETLYTTSLSSNGSHGGYLSRQTGRLRM
jgi:twitching motility protein PilJ